MTSEDILRARVALGMSQAAFAAAVGARARETVNRWEAGKQSPLPVYVVNIRRLIADLAGGAP